MTTGPRRKPPRAAGRPGAAAVIVVGAIALMLTVGARQTFGLFLAPEGSLLSLDRGAFAFAVALQNIVWGVAQPFFAAVADRFGPFRIMAAGAILYAAGLCAMAEAVGPFGLNFGAGILVGLGLAATSYGVVFGAVSRVVPVDKQTLALGFVGAAGSFGQFVFLPPTQHALSQFGPAMTALGLAVIVGMLAPLAAAFAEHEPARRSTMRWSEVSAAVQEAGRHRGFLLLNAGFFICGFQIMFIATHLPAFLTGCGLDPSVGADALAAIGLFNIAGTLAAGWLGQRLRKKYVLAALYFSRTLVIAGFLVLPVTPWSAIAISALIGTLWLGSVPVTSGLVAQIFGPDHAGTLFALVFLSHQLGSFLGAWTGGLIYDWTGSYSGAWMVVIALGIVAGVLHLAIHDAPRRRTVLAPA